MDIPKNGHEQAAVSLAPIETDMTLEEFLQSDLDAGTRLVWVIEPVAKTVTVYRSKTDIKTLMCDDTLSGEDVVEGFSCQVAQLFE